MRRVTDEEAENLLCPMSMGSKHGPICCKRIRCMWYTKHRDETHWDDNEEKFVQREFFFCAGGRGST